MKTIIHAPAVYEYLLDPSEFAPIVNLIKDLDHRPEWKDSITMGQTAGYRTSASFHISHNTQHQEIKTYDSLLYTIFNTAVLEYQKCFEVKIGSDEGYELLRYTNGQQYKKHIDQGGHQFGRIVSGLLYMNKDYDGGELELLHFGVKIKPSAPSIILFPSNYVYEHVAHPVTSGYKYAVVTFFHPLDELVEKNKSKQFIRMPPSLYGATNL